MANERGLPFSPEQNSVPPVERGGFVLPVTTEPRTPTPTREVPHGAPEKPKKKKTWGRKAFAGGVGTVLVLGGTAWGLNETFGDKEPTPQTRSIDSVPGGTSNPAEGGPQLEGLPPNLEQQPNNSDIKKTDEYLKKFFATVEIIEVPGVISESKLLRLPQAEIDRLYPTAFGKLSEAGKTIISLSQPSPSKEMAERVGSLQDLSFEVGEDKNTLQFQNPLDLRLSSNPNAKIKFTKSYSGLTQTDRDAFQGKGHYDTYKFYSVPKGTIIQAPVDGFLVISKTNGVIYSNSEKVMNGIIDFQAPNGNIYRLGIAGQRGNSIFLFKPLLDAPELKPEYNHKPVGSYGAPIKRGQPLFEPTTELDQLTFIMWVATKGEIGKPPQLITNPFVPTNIEFLASPDGKLITSE